MKACGQCGLPLDNHRRTYHEACLPAARAAAQLAKRRCGRCRKTRAASKFVNDATRPDGKFPWCVDCQAAGFASGRFQNPEHELNGNVCPLCDTPIRGHRNRKFCSAKCKDRVKALGQKFGLAVEEYKALVAATGGFCPLCRCRPRMWAVDHNHRTGLVTGVVCTGCNVGLLAASRHDIERVEALAAYLTQTPAQRLGITACVPEEYKPATSQLHKIWRHGAAS